MWLALSLNPILIKGIHGMPCINALFKKFVIKAMHAEHRSLQILLAQLV